ncbi:ankyrin repeat-containing domain protein [Aspergillus spectabilis]
MTVPRDMNAFVQTCRSLHTLYGEKLYKRTLVHNKLFNAVNWAAENESLATLKKLIDAGLDPHRDFVYHPLCNAAGHGHVVINEYFLHEHKVNTIKVYGEPLDKAIRGSDMRIVGMVVAALKKDYKNTQKFLGKVGNQGMNTAVQVEGVESVRLLLDEGVPLNGSLTPWIPVPLRSAIERNSPAVLNMLLDRGASVKSVASYREGPPEPAVLDLLLDRRASAGSAATYEVGPLELTTSRNHVEVARILLDCGLVCPAASDLEIALENGWNEMLQLLMTYVADSNDVLLNNAIWSGSERVVAMLMRAGIDAEAQKEAFILAGRKGSLSVVVAVVELGMRRLVHNFGHLAVLEAAENRHAEVVKYLLERELDLSRTDLNSLLLASVRNGWNDITSQLLETGADPTCQGSDGLTALSLAVIRGDVAIVLTLLDNGGLWDIDAPDLYGRTPLLLATRLGLNDIVSILLKRGSSAIHTAAQLGYTPFSFVSEHMKSNYGDWRDNILQVLWAYLSHPEPGSNSALESDPGRVVEQTWPFLRLCNVPLSPFEEYLSCAACGFLICRDCVPRGETCGDPSHFLVKKSADTW